MWPIHSHTKIKKKKTSFIFIRSSGKATGIQPSVERDPSLQMLTIVSPTNLFYTRSLTRSLHGARTCEKKTRTIVSIFLYELIYLAIFLMHATQSLKFTLSHAYIQTQNARFPPARKRICVGWQVNVWRIAHVIAQLKLQRNRSFAWRIGAI